MQSSAQSFARSSSRSNTGKSDVQRPTASFVKAGPQPCICNKRKILYSRLLQIRCCAGARPLDLYADEGCVDAPRENAFKAIFWEGGTQGDAFLTAAAAQVAAEHAYGMYSVLPALNKSSGLLSCTVLAEPLRFLSADQDLFSAACTSRVSGAPSCYVPA